MADKVLEGFSISLEKMKRVAAGLAEDFEKGLANEDDSPVKMLITYVHSMPDGTEQGDFMALDLGGSNFRVLLIKLDKGKVTQIDKQMVIDDATKHGTQEMLFDFIAKSVSDFIKEQKISSMLPLGFTFSFPVHQNSLVSGTLIRWTKNFSASGTEGKDVVLLLKDAFVRNGNINVDVVALVNDTTGTQLAVGINDPECHVGLILGTGTNACYMESLDSVPKFKGDRSRYSKVVINTEWGAFGDNGKLDFILTDIDKQLDELVVNKGQQRYEKMISGKYVGEVCRLTMGVLNKQSLLFSESPSEKFNEFMSFDTKLVSLVEGGNTVDIQALMKKEFSMAVSEADCAVMKRVCTAVSSRAARLAAAGIVSLVKKINKLDGCSVAVDGSLYKKHPFFATRMKEAMDELAPGNKIVMKLSEDGSGKGAAIVAAVACRLKASGEYD